MDWKRSATGALIVAYGFGAIYGDHYFASDHIGPGMAKVITATAGSSTVAPSSALVPAPHVNLISDFEYEAMRSSAPLKNDGVKVPLFQRTKA